MVPLVPCRSITTCASPHPQLSIWYATHCAWISAVMFHSSRRHDVKTAVAVLCLPSSGSSSVYCRQASLPSFRRQHTPTFHRTSLTVTRGFQTASQKIPIFTRCMECRRGLTMRFLSVCLSVRLSVCQTRALWQNDMFRFLYHMKELLS